jgi:predicted DNA-binding transcriptional regulator AlpA
LVEDAAMTHPPQRRLLDAHAVADKLGYAKSTFDKKRFALEAAGFPRPTLSACQFGTARWDEGAIDAWFDSRLGDDQRPGRRISMPPDSEAVAERLARRAREMAI